jgi:hypothetical protein
MDKDILQKLLDEDALGLLNTKSKLSAETSSDKRLRDSFMEIVEFVRTNGKHPEPNKNDVKEMMLYSRLNGLRQESDKIALLADLDELGLLVEEKKLESIDDIFASDKLNILSDSATDIFKLKNVPDTKVIVNASEYIAKRRPCDDFESFEPLFKQCQRDLKATVRVLSPFRAGSSIDPGDIFVLKGQLVFVASEREREHQPNADKGKLNDRLRCIFENSTECDMLRRSLAARLYESDGQRVSKNTHQLFNSVNEVSEDDRLEGHVYILRSLSKDPQISALKNLFKIGFCRGNIEDRVANAAQDPTYLMAPVKIVSGFQLYALNPQKLEYFLHRFFAEVCLDVTVANVYSPKEWFVAPLEIITEAVHLLKTGEIVHFRYNAKTETIERHKK